MLRFLGPLVRRSCGPCKVGLRSFAEASAAMQSAPARIPSVPTHGTYGRYALALYMAGQKVGKLDVIDKDLQQVCEGFCKWVTCAALERLSTSESVQVWKLASESEEFAQFLRDPSVPKKQKSKVLQDVLSDVKVSELTKNFFRAPSLFLLHQATERVLQTLPRTRRCQCGFLQMCKVRVRKRQWYWQRTTV